MALDYFHPEVIAGTGRSPGLRSATDILRRVRAPWIGSIADAGELARSAGLRVVEDTPLAALLGRLLPGLDLGADAGAEYKLCVLSKAPSTRES